MKTLRNGISGYVTNSPRFIRPPFPGSRYRREDLIFQAILPVRIQLGDYAAESPGDWGNRVLAEGDLSGSLLA